ncbi:MAG: hypothetical protein WD875_07090, partial [Pirellulales bacterium]
KPLPIPTRTHPRVEWTATLIVAFVLWLPIPHTAPTWRWSERPWFANGEPTYRLLRAAWPDPRPIWRGKSLTVYYDVERNVACCVFDAFENVQPAVGSDGHSTWIVRRVVNHRFECEGDGRLVLVRFTEDDSRQLDVPAMPDRLKSEFASQSSPRGKIVELDDEEILRRVIAVCAAENAERIRQFLK